MLTNWFKKEEEPRADRDYQTIYKIVRELDRQGLQKFLKGVEALWEGYNALRTLKTIDEKEDAKEAKETKDISDIENNFIETEQK